MEILYCSKCIRFTFEKSCPVCKCNTISTKPPRYSPIDKWGDYRRKAKDLNLF